MKICLHSKMYKFRTETIGGIFFTFSFIFLVEVGFWISLHLPPFEN